MTDKLMDMRCTEFADALAAKQSVPGGGGAAAYVGALGVALCSMVGNFTTGKKRYAEYEGDIQRMLSDAAEVQARLIRLVDDDAAAFEPLSRAYGIPKDDPSRDEVLEQATQAACVAPLEMMRQIAHGIELLEEMEQKGSRMLLSDVGCGAAACGAALRSASLNVFVNTKSYAESDWAREAERECVRLLDEYAPRATAVEQRVAEAIRTH